MRRSAVITVNGEDMTVKELTVRQVEELMAAIEAKDYQGHILDALMNRPFPALAVFMALGIDEGQFSLDISPTEIDQIYGKVIEVNPFCAAMMKNLYEIGTRRLQSGQRPAS